MNVQHLYRPNEIICDEPTSTNRNYMKNPIKMNGNAAGQLLGPSKGPKVSARKKTPRARNNSLDVNVNPAEL